MKLFCFPYGGGSASIFTKWKPFIGSEIQLKAIELAGRGRRIDEAFYTDFDALIKDVLCLIKKDIEVEKYVLFGHSFGAKIAFELAREINAIGLPGPRHIFFSGRGAPYTPGKNEKNYDDLTDDEFINELLEIGGTSDDFFKQSELLNIFLPILRSDFKLAERGEVENKKIIPLDGDITIFLGKEDDLTPEQVDNWKYYTEGICTIHYFSGGHFFINDQYRKVISKIKDIITRI